MKKMVQKYYTNNQNNSYHVTWEIQCLHYIKFLLHRKFCAFGVTNYSLEFPPFL